MVKRRPAGLAAVVLVACGVGLSSPAEAGLDVRDPNVVAVGGTLALSFRVPVTLPAGGLLVLDVDADVIGSTLDSRLTVLGPDGSPLAANDNDPFTFDSALGVVIPVAGLHTIAVEDAQARVGANLFFLLKGLFRPLQRLGTTVATGAGASFLTVAGTLEVAPWTVQVTVPANQVLLLDVDAEELGSPLDSVLEVLDAGGAVIARNDDDLRTFDSALAVKIPAAGTYTLRITDFQGRTGAGHFFLLKGSLVPAP